MIRDLDDTIEELLKTRAPVGSELAGATINFDIPDGNWRQKLNSLTVNCYLYDIQENQEIRTAEPILQRNGNGSQAIRRQAPARVDCAYCITGWSPAKDEAVLEEHRLLSQVLTVLLKNRTIPADVLKGSLVNQIPPYPTVVVAPSSGKNQPEFWRALDQQLKPSLNYVVTLALMLDEPLPDMTPTVVDVVVETKNLQEI